MRRPTFPLFALCALVGAPLAAETLDGQTCVFNFNNKAFCLQRTSTGALVQVPDLLPAELLRGLPPVMGTPAAASGPVLDGEGCFLTYVDEAGDLTLCSDQDGSDKSWTSLTVFRKEDLKPAGKLAQAVETKAEAAAPAVESKQTTAAPASPVAVLATVLAKTGERARDSVDAFVAKQVADHRSRQAQGKLVGLGLARVIGKDATRFMERFR